MDKTHYDRHEERLNQELMLRLPVHFRLPNRKHVAGRVIGLPTIAELMFIVDMGSWTKLSIIQNLWQWNSMDRVYMQARKVEIKFGCKIFTRIELPSNLSPVRRFSYHGTLILELAKRLLTNYASLIIDMEAVGYSVREMYGERTKGVYKYIPEVYDPRRMYMTEEIVHSFVNPCFKEKVMAKAKAVVHQSPVEGEPQVETPVTESTSSDAPPRKAPRQAFRVDHFIFVQKNTGKLAAQAQIILNHIEAAGEAGITKKDLVDQLTKDEKFITRQPVERVLTYYQRPLIDGGYVVSKQSEGVTPANDSGNASEVQEQAA